VPYRSRKEGARREAPKTGAVADMVKQFADPYAFVRELVQNGIDAGAQTLEVSVEHSGTTAAVSVRDDGKGMTRAIIEGPLLTLFFSEKEGDSTKIGKYGVGFVSVFSIEPDEVVVETWRSEGAWRLSLHPDYSYELEAIEPRPGSGTVVTVVKTMEGDAFELHVARVREALSRWCRHARLPIELTVRRRGGTSTSESSQQQMTLASPVSVTHREGDETMIVGAASDSFAGFYNHGLTLYETEQAPSSELDNIHFKIDSPHLAHTLSRDNVRHDAHYARLLKQVEEMVDGPLRKALAAALEEEVLRVAEGGDATRYAALLSAASSRPFNFPLRKLPVALTDRLANSGRAVCSASDVVMDACVRKASEPSALTAALAARGVPVARIALDEIDRALGRATDMAVLDAGALYAVVEELDGDDELLRETRAALDAMGASTDALVFGRMSGRTLPNAAVAVDEGPGPHIVSGESGRRWWRRLGSIDKLALDSESTAVIRARALARRDAAAAGQLLARYLVTEALGEVSTRRSDALLELAARRREGE
jgi:molecular chaperone HtpG